MHPLRTLLIALTVAVPLLAAAGGGKTGSNGESKQAPVAGQKGGATPQRPAPPAAPGIASPNAVRDAGSDDLVFGAPVKYQNLTLVPVATTRKGPFQRYTLLEQGIAKKTLAVRELRGTSGQAQVSAVEVRNSGADPVYLLGGEMILGGQQDRIIERDTVVPPSGGWEKVSVFCVEQGRWRGQNMDFAPGEALAHVGLRQAALSGDQSQVWAEVARKNLQHGTQSQSGTYRRTIQKPELRAQIAPYRARIVEQMAAGQETAGLVFAINGQIRVADLFGNPELFSDLRDKLLSAYVLEALGQKVMKDAAPLSTVAAKEFFLESRKAKKQLMQSSGGRSVNYKAESPIMIGSETLDPAVGEKVRETYIIK
ncbi:MAG: hypothetical protein EXR72_25295 [Myxococcales bacterium]|nr:hypothetical protein [Myxococcales bacterium]